MQSNNVRKHLSNLSTHWELDKCPYLPKVDFCLYVEIPYCNNLQYVGEVNGMMKFVSKEKEFVISNKKNDPIVSWLTRFVSYVDIDTEMKEFFDGKANYHFVLSYYLTCKLFRARGFYVTKDNHLPAFWSFDDNKNLVLFKPYENTHTMHLKLKDNKKSGAWRTINLFIVLLYGDEYLVAFNAKFKGDHYAITIRYDDHKFLEYFEHIHGDYPLEHIVKDAYSK